MYSHQPPSPFGASSAGAQNLRQGQYFNYVVPSGWHVTEDGQFAVVLVAPDQAALTLMVGNSGLPLHYNPGQFVYEKLMAMQPVNLWMGQARSAAPLAGCSVAYEFDYTCLFQGLPWRGIAKCSIAYAYNICTMVVTSAIAQECQWPSYAAWLPQIANQVTATNGAAFGVQGMMAQNIEISIAEGQQQQKYREWSQQTWNEVSRQRGESTDRQQAQFRENLGNTGTWTNSYGYPVAQLPTTYQYFWMNRQGQVYGTNNPHDNPNVGSTQDWVRMQRHQP